MLEENDRRSRRETARGRSRKRPVSGKRKAKKRKVFLTAAVLTLLCAAGVCAVLWMGCPSREEKESPGILIQEETFPDGP